MAELSMWLVRWSMAGALIAAGILIVCWLAEIFRLRVALVALRTALLLCLLSPFVALAPPLVLIEASAFSPTPVVRALATLPDSPATPSADGPTDASPESIPAEKNWPRLTVDPSTLMAVIAVVWLLGAGTFAARYYYASRRLRELFAAGRSVPQGMTGLPCRLSAAASGVYVFGLLRPRMIAPIDFLTWPDAELRAALAHEAAHVRRGDLGWGIVGEAVRVLYWWAPPIHWLVAAHGLATEESCDSESIAQGLDAHDYASALVALARRYKHSESGGLAMVRRSSLPRRVENLLGAKRGAIAASLLGVAVSVLAVGAALAGPLQSAALTPNLSDEAVSSCVCSDAPPFVRPWAVRELDRATLGNQNALLMLARSNLREDRTAAVRALGDWPTAAARAALRSALSDRDFAVRAEAVAAIARNPGEDIALIEAALQDPSCHVAAAAAEAMSEVRLASAEPVLTAYAASNACVVRLAAIESLGSYRTQASASALRGALSDEDARVRSSAATSLARLGDEAAIGELRRQVVSDGNKHVRQAAADALGRIALRGDDEVISALALATRDSEEHVRYASVEALARVGDARAQDALAQRLSDENTGVRIAAAETLGELGDVTALPALAQASRDRDEGVRVAATAAAEQIRARAARARL